MILVLTFCMIIFIIIQNANQKHGSEVSTLGYKTKFFYISDGASEKIVEKMKIDHLPVELIHQFIVMEDAFLELEQLAVCNLISMRNKGFNFSDKIKESYPDYDFSYHITHIKQMSEPHKLINQNIIC